MNMRIKLKHLLEEGVVGTIRTSDVYNFYFLFYYKTHEPSLFNNSYAREMEQEYLTKIKNKYVATFKALMVDQINKYIRRSRVDRDMIGMKPVTINASGDELAGLMKKTFRSDMSRRNDVWNFAADEVAALEGVHSIDQMYKHIDRLNNAIHNTHTLILGKLGDISNPIGTQLEQAYETCATAKDIRAYQGMVSKDLRDIVRSGPEI